MTVFVACFALLVYFLTVIPEYNRTKQQERINDAQIREQLREREAGEAFAKVWQDACKEASGAIRDYRLSLETNQ